MMVDEGGTNLVDLDSNFVKATFEEMQSSDIEQLKGFLLNPDYGDMSRKKKKAWKKKKVQYLLKTNAISIDRMSMKVDLLSYEEDVKGVRKRLTGVVTDIVYDENTTLKWVLHFSQTGIGNHHRYCSVEALEKIISGMTHGNLVVSNTKINTYAEEYRGQEGVEPVELILVDDSATQDQPSGNSQEINNTSVDPMNGVEVGYDIESSNNNDSSQQNKGMLDEYSTSASNDIVFQSTLSIPQKNVHVVSPIRKTSCCDTFEQEVSLNTKCRLCKGSVYSNFTSEVEQMMGQNSKSTYIQMKLRQSLCIRCSVDLFQYEKKNEAKALLVRFLHSKVRKYSWKYKQDIEVISFLRRCEHGLNELADVYSKSAAIFDKFFPNKTIVRCIDRRDKKGVLRQKHWLRSRKQHTIKLNGAEFTSVEDYKDILHYAVGVQDLDENHVGLILLPGDNYITIMNGNFPADDVVSLAIMHTSEMCNKSNLSKRAGSALGFVTSASISSSIPSSCDPTLLPSSTGVSANVTWKSNIDGQQKLFTGVYADGFLHHQTSKQKRNELLKNSYMNHILIRKGISRLVSAVILETYNIDTSKTSTRLLKWLDNDLRKSRNSEKAGTCFHRLCDSLCKYMCTFGRSNNFQALAAHIDGNYVSKMETVTINGRVTEEDVNNAMEHLGTKHRNNACYELVRENMKDGFLFMPLDGIVLRMRGGVDVMNCNLDNTIHVPDLSRNTVNFSTVEGGCDND